MISWLKKVISFGKKIVIEFVIFSQKVWNYFTKTPIRKVVFTIVVLSVLFGIASVFGS